MADTVIDGGNFMATYPVHFLTQYLSSDINIFVHGDATQLVVEVASYSFKILQIRKLNSC